MSVVNALSSKLDLEIHRDGSKWEMSFAKGGKQGAIAAVQEKLANYKHAQVQAYGIAVQRATGMPVRCVILEV